MLYFLSSYCEVLCMFVPWFDQTYYKRYNAILCTVCCSMVWLDVVLRLPCFCRVSQMFSELQYACKDITGIAPVINSM